MFFEMLRKKKLCTSHTTNGRAAVVLRYAATEEDNDNIVNKLSAYERFNVNDNNNNNNNNNNARVLLLNPPHAVHFMNRHTRLQLPTNYITYIILCIRINIT